MRGRGRQFTLAAQAVHHRGRFAIHHVEQVALRVGGRVGHRHLVLGQVFHQLQIKRQLRTCQPLEQGYHKGALVGGGEVVGVFDAASAAFQILQLAQPKLAQKGAGLVKRDLGVHRHGS